MLRVLIFGLIAFFIYSAIELVSARYEQRQQFTQIERATRVERELETQWRFLELERAQLTSSMNIRSEIEEKLKKMHSPQVNEIIYIKESELSPISEVGSE
ncbi:MULTISPECIES: cell division protein FtsL [Oligella]|uniref:Cell division protein FtsL n=2 Tax=Oligella urethralis TaxID=90245 RepID=A0A096AND5_9BURK|nr:MULTISPECIES: cell division protein FtsL [Oligella]AVL70360.1 cell division protein FtsL [Oligella urethralis]KGF32147.1 cell division protein [Oligella urethralis DNF00040]MDK6203112.1 cell division protein FtsL [Oligella urethralis]OFS83946.1 cell division protein [Oligella sp. HMSC05A10]OFV49155.1 cell division protein [Oligella sp. HMSC09E12]